MVEKVITNAKGEDTGVRAYYAHDGKELAKFYPEREEKWGTYPKSGRPRLIQKAHKPMLSINTMRTYHHGEWWDKTYIERIYPEYKAELEELLAKYEGVIVTEHSYL